MAQKCVDVLNSKSEIIFSGRDDCMDDYCWDVSLEKIRRDMRYEPQVGIEQAIKEMAEFLKSRDEK